MTAKIDISPEQLAIVQGILKDHLPGGTLAWVFGSRVTWTAKPFSDLDIALEGAKPLPPEVLIDLEEAFEASDLPWKVEMIDLNAVSPEFRAIVKRQRVPADWAEKNLSDVFVFSSGLSKSRSEFGSGFPFLTFKDVFYNTFVPSELGGLVTSTESERTKCSVQRGDVFLTRTSETFDELGMSCVALVNVPTATFNGFTKRLRPKVPEELSPEYLGYYFKSPKFRSAVNAVSTMSTRASLNNGMLAVLPLVLPPLFEQANIAEVLKTLDDKIQLNRRMNETLEAMARTVFRDWFVDFGPTRRKAAGLTDPAAILGGLLPDPTQAAPLAALFPDRLGDNGLPEGWGEREVGELCPIVGGGTPSTKEPAFWDGGTQNWATPKDLSKLSGLFLRETERQVTDAGLAKVSSGLSPSGSVLLSSRAPIGYVAVADKPVAVNQGFIVMQPTPAFPTEFAYFWTLENLDLIKANANGSTFQEISKKNFRPLRVNHAGDDLTARFADVVGPMMDLIRNNEQENQTLATTRGLLLPKLMSGDLRMTGAEGVV